MDKKRSAWQKINDLKVIINDEENKELVRLIKKELKELIREITPVKYDVNVRYGCEEPYRQDIRSDCGYIWNYRCSV